MSNNTRHVPVMLQRCLDLLAPALAEPGAVVVDCTLGLGGHSEALLSTFPAARLIALDRDPSALKLAGERLAPYGDRATLVHAVYDELPEVLDRLGTPRVQGVLFDLGVSSMQLDEADRGFAYAQDAPLDMRMDQSATSAPRMSSTPTLPVSWSGSCAPTGRRSRPSGSSRPSSASGPRNRSPTARGWSS